MVRTMALEEQDTPSTPTSEGRQGAGGFFRQDFVEQLFKLSCETLNGQRNEVEGGCEALNTFIPKREFLFWGLLTVRSQLVSRRPLTLIKDAKGSSRKKRLNETLVG